MFLNDLTIGYPIEIHGLDLDCLSRRWDTEESPLVRASHGEARGHLVAFCYQLLLTPPMSSECPGSPRASSR